MYHKTTFLELDLFNERTFDLSPLFASLFPVFTQNFSSGKNLRAKFTMNVIKDNAIQIPHYAPVSPPNPSIL